MRNLKWTILSLCCVVVSYTALAQDTTTDPLTPVTFEGQVDVRLSYLLYLPPEYEQLEQWPLVLFLHGAGERGDDLNRVKVHGPPKRVANGDNFPFVLVSPQCPAGEWWTPQSLLALLDDVTNRYKIDPDRVYLTGLSMGGYGTWALAATAPDRFAAIVPICGGGIPYQTRLLKNVPAWVFHGAKDSVVPLEQSEKMVEAMKKHGGSVKLTIYPEANHDSWTETYDNPELYKWLLSQKRGS